MRITRLRDKLLFSVVAISILVAAASMLAVSLVIRQQHLDQSNALLRKAALLIEDELQERKDNQLTASRGLATQHNFGSTIWYLAQYAQSDLDHETLFNSYQQLLRETYKLGRAARLSKALIYDANGQLVSFALLDGGAEQVGFVERFPAPLFQIAALKEGEELSRKSMRSATSVDRIELKFNQALPRQESAHYAVIDGTLALESFVPIIGMAFDAGSGKQEKKQLGLIVTVQALNQALVEQLARLTDTRINIFMAGDLSGGSEPGYRKPDWHGVPSGVDGKFPPLAFNEIAIAGAGFYQCLMPLYNGSQLAGTIVALQSKEIVQKNTTQMMQTLGLIGLASLVFIFPFAWYFATSISQPLSTLSRIFREVARGTKTETLNEAFDQLREAKQRHDELGDLTQSFILMADAVKQKIEQIHEINAHLEQKIEESTAQLRAANVEMLRLANTDALTGLYNRRAFFEIAALVYAQARRSQCPLCFIMLDIDYFKSINDRYGHPIGDEVLRQVAHCLAITARASDTPARYGGEEFAILASDTALEDGLVLAERIRSALREIKVDVNEHTITPTASLGVACLSGDETLEQLCIRADAALYLAKETGRDRSVAAG